MPVEMGIWRVDGDEPRRLGSSMMATESMLQDFLAKDPTLLGERLLVIGREVQTAFGKRIDLLAIDGDGNLHVLELKRDKTPREVVAQVLDYGSWVTSLGEDEVRQIANDHLKGEPFEAAFERVFEASPPDELNLDLHLTIVASQLDASSERIVRYLRGFNVPINAVFFTHLEDDGRRYLARSWLASEQEDASPSAGSGRHSGKQADWNGRDWYVNFGDERDGRRWEDGRRYDFVSAGGGPWYSKSLRKVPVGARVNVYVPGHGYVAVGEVVGNARRFDNARVDVDGQRVPLAGQPLAGTYVYAESGGRDTDDMAEWILPVRWQVAVPMAQAFRVSGMFASQLSACKLRQDFTLERLAAHFHLTEE